MKTICRTLLFCFVALSCSSTRKAKNDLCNENLDFKHKFFYHVATVEKYTTEQNSLVKRTISTDSVTKAFQFISKYTSVSKEILGYSFGYPTIEKFEIDKKNWLSWYESNKCNNLH